MHMLKLYPYRRLVNGISFDRLQTRCKTFPIIKKKKSYMKCIFFLATPAETGCGLKLRLEKISLPKECSLKKNDPEPTRNFKSRQNENITLRLGEM